ncbi:MULTISPECIES: hypothetical protein [Lactobacillales]|jgi:hypothetical protein|uniref:Uncharacterized protein n=2 Tax=Leuconostoc TaxID=1243 RepID=A0A2N9KGW5_9LACO|nr:MULTISPECIES: hypothetical protein [Lactobacillaceae]MBC9722947.1 hypothetical protein [Lactobacillus sp.]ABJ63158.1 hypothetical protein LEUM_A16 [Leuconostoc mesenteroides subsp. mesenteroides ATCC 8293]ASR69661.1 hypothetical protein CBW60_09750 [Leuconostoc mesenteroides]KAA8346522.1 hypothetical protein FE418_09890 [Leuconostoc mesenteroides]MBM7436623.1 hypothetical protein [Leuconostoc rapi]
MRRPPKKQDFIQKHPLPFIICAVIIVAVIGLSIFSDNSGNSESESSSSVSHKQSSSSEEDSSESFSDDESSSSDEIESSSSSSTDNSKDYEDKVNSLLKGTAQYATYDKSTNTLTYVGYDDWANYSNSDLRDAMDILETIANRQAVVFDMNNPAINVQLPNGTIIATSDGTDDIEFSN